MSRSDETGSVAGRCPTCKKPTVREFRPFCSRRCADVDLSRWLSGTYVISGREETSNGARDNGQSRPAEEEADEPDPDADLRSVALLSGAG